MDTLVQLLPLIILVVLMYFLMIRPQKKKDKEVQAMRSALTVGDEIVTIGGICGKIVKTKDETIIIQVGSDKVKLEMMKWSVSSVTKESNRRAYAAAAADDTAYDDAPKKVMPKRLKKSADVEPEAEVEAPVAEAAETVVEAVEEAVEK